MNPSNGIDRDDVRSTDAKSDDANSPLSLLFHHIRRLNRREQGEESFRYVYETYYDRVRRFFSRRGMAPDECRELTQETFLRVIRGEGVFGSTAEFEAWLFTLAVNLYRNAQRARHAEKRRGLESPLDEWLQEHGGDLPSSVRSSEQSPLDDYLGHERMVLLGEALNALPKQMQRCIVLRLHHEWKYQEIADELGISLGTVKAHLHQGKRQLKQRLARYLERSPRELGQAGR